MVLIEILRDLDLSCIERFAYLAKLVTGVLAILENDNIDSSHLIIKVTSIVLLALGIQVAEIRKSAAASRTENHSLKVHLFFLLNSASHVADRYHSWKSYSLSYQRNSLFFKLILIVRFIKSALSSLGSSLHILQLDPLIMFLFFDFALPLHFLCLLLLCALDDLSCNSDHAFVLEENVEVGAHILQHLDLLLQELLLLLDLGLDVVQKQILRLPSLLENAQQTIVEVVDGANLVHLYSHLFAF